MKLTYAYSFLVLLFVSFVKLKKKKKKKKQIGEAHPETPNPGH